MLAKYLKISKLLIISIALGILFFSSLSTLKAEEGIMPTHDPQEKTDSQYRASLQNTPEQRKDTEEAKNEIDAYTRYMPASKTKAMSGEVELINSQIRYSHEFKAYDKLPMVFYLSTQHLAIENSAPVKLPAHLNGLSTTIETTLPFFHFQNTYFRFGISPSFYGDSWAFSRADFRIPQYYLFIYKPNEKWIFLAGLAINPEYANMIPLLAGTVAFGVRYQPNERLIFDLMPVRPNITYSLNKRWKVFTEFDIADQEFETQLNDLKTAVLCYKEARIGAGLKYQINRFLLASLQGGRVFNRRFQYKDSLGKVNIKDDFYTEFRLEAEF